jgi:hypothetical protein
MIPYEAFNDQQCTRMTCTFSSTYFEEEDRRFRPEALINLHGVEAEATMNYH